MPRRTAGNVGMMIPNPRKPLREWDEVRFGASADIYWVVRSAGGGGTWCGFEFLGWFTLALNRCAVGIGGWRACDALSALDVLLLNS